MADDLMLGSASNALKIAFSTLWANELIAPATTVLRSRHPHRFTPARRAYACPLPYTPAQHPRARPNRY